MALRTFHDDEDEDEDEDYDDEDDDRKEANNVDGILEVSLLT
jgi:hypothetical protein